MKPPGIDLEQIRQLGPPYLTTDVPVRWADANGHMNMRWYVALFDDAGDELHERLGLTAEFHSEHGTGTMDLEHHTNFLSEVMPGDQVSIYVRAVGSNTKRLHYLMFLVDDTTGKLAALFECMNAFADLRIRRTAPWPPEIKQRIDALVSRHSDLEWPAPVSGSLAL